MTSLIIARVLLKTLRQSCWKRFHSRLSPTSLVKRYGDFSFLAPPTISPEEIDALLAHRFMIFGHQFQLPEQINWHYDPLSDYVVERRLHLLHHSIFLHLAKSRRESGLGTLALSAFALACRRIFAKARSKTA
ncbi:MAG: hypothetical protein RML35_05470 [Chloroherpetonaceae bacterium]|nr:hypothetical protein [Chloroherpetonaceae bacterium]